MSQHPQIADRKRGTWLRTVAPLIMLLTVPCYCVGISVLSWERLIVPTATRVGSRVLDYLFTPVGLVVAVLFLLVLLTEPFHGGVTNVGALGIDVATSLDPAGCLIVLALLFLVGTGVLLWAADINVPTVPTEITQWMERLRAYVPILIDWLEQVREMLRLYEQRLSLS